MAPDKLAPAPTFPVKPLFGIITDPCVNIVVTSNIYIEGERSVLFVEREYRYKYKKILLVSKEN